MQFWRFAYVRSRPMRKERIIIIIIIRIIIIIIIRIVPK